MNKIEELKDKIKKLKEEVETKKESLKVKEEKLLYLEEELKNVLMSSNSKTFWELIKYMNWSSDHDYERIKKEIKQGKYVSKKRIEEFKKEYDEKYNYLYEFIDSMSDSEYSEYIGESDDGLWDFISNIIGSGEESYKEVLKNIENFKKYKAIENFSYSFE